MRQLLKFWAVYYDSKEKNAELKMRVATQNVQIEGLIYVHVFSQIIPNTARIPNTSVGSPQAASMDEETILNG